MNSNLALIQMADIGPEQAFMIGYNTGYEFFLQKDGEEINPFPKNSELRMHWYRGWDKAIDEIEEDKAS
jgi:hypothetical protein